jgi:predicted RNA polymerase sigma factor
MMTKAVEQEEFSCYHYEAAIAAEHVRAQSFEQTNWDKILYYYQALYAMQPMPTHILTMAVISMQNRDYQNARVYLNDIDHQDLGQRVYLYYGAEADYYHAANQLPEAHKNIDKALDCVTNILEKEYLQKKKVTWLLNIGEN